MEDGLHNVDGQLIYYKNGAPYHAGAIKINGSIYYIATGGKAVTGRYRIHSDMTNGILKRGYYTFDDECKLVDGTYEAPEKKKKKKKKIAQKEIEFLIFVAVVVAVVLIRVILKSA